MTETRPPTRREAIAEKLKRYDDATAAFNAIYVPWGRLDFAYPVPDGYREALDAMEMAEHALHVTAIDDIRELLRDAASLLRDEGEPQTATITACGLSVSQLHRAVARLDKQAECEAGTHEWGGTPAGMQCRWCRVLIAGPLAEAIWKAVAEDQP